MSKINSTALLLTGILFTVLAQDAASLRASVTSDQKHFYESADTKKGVLLAADSHNYVLCDNTAGPLVGKHLQRSLRSRHWIYEMSGSEPDRFDGRFYFSKAELMRNPNYAPMATLDRLKKNNWYYVMSDIPLFFRCDTGFETVYECGNGLIEGEQWAPDAQVRHVNEECDDGNTGENDGCESCIVSEGWSCSGSPSVCMDTVARNDIFDEPVVPKVEGTSVGKSSSSYPIFIGNTLSDGSLEKITAAGPSGGFLSLFTGNTIVATESELDPVDSTQTVAGFRFENTNAEPLTLRNLIFEMQAKNISVRAYSKDGEPKTVLRSADRPENEVPCDIYITDELPLSSQAFTGTAYVVCTEIDRTVDSGFSNDSPLNLELIATLLDTQLDGTIGSSIQVKLDRITNPLMRHFGILQSHITVIDSNNANLYWLNAGQDQLLSRKLSRKTDRN